MIFRVIIAPSGSVVRLLVELGADIDHHEDNRGRTALTDAVGRGDEAMAWWLQIITTMGIV